jgi:hypothetical protein
MNKFRLTFRILAIAAFTVSLATLAQAQATRTWVSGVGDDANPCSRTAPCKTFAGAIAKTATGGEIDALDPGGFGTVTVTKSITLDGTGTLASILASGTNGINVNGTDIVVRVRGLSINGAGSTIGVNGINFISGAALFVEDTVIDTFSNMGVGVITSTENNEIHIRNSSIRNCNDGVRITNTGSFVTSLGLDNVNISHNSTGLNAGNGTRGQVSNSFFGQNSANQVNASQVGSSTSFTVSDSTLVGNGSGVGINTGAGTHVRIARVLITNNNNALGLSGTVDTGGNNTIMGNGTDQSPNGTLFVQK